MAFGTPVATDSSLNSSAPATSASPTNRESLGARRQFLNSCVIVDLIDGSYLPFQWSPSEVTESKSVNWEEKQVSGRSCPVKGYSNSGATQIGLQLEFVDDAGIQDPEGSLLVKDVARWLKSFGYPDYRSGLIASPHPVYLQIGEMIKMKAVIASMAITYKSEAGWDYKAKYAKKMEANIQFEEFYENPLDYWDIRKDLGVSVSSFTAPAQGLISGGNPSGQRIGKGNELSNPTNYNALLANLRSNLSSFGNSLGLPPLIDFVDSSIAPPSNSDIGMG